ncbi:MAG: class I SAM-dependent methyltransferase [Flavipsychrobacter sp.]
MDKNYEEVYHNEELTNWWFVARRDMLMKLFAQYKIPKEAKILDIGCAGAVFLLELKKLGYTNLHALDYSAEAIAQAKKNGLEHAHLMDGHYPDFEEGAFDVIVASDSLEHLEKDEVALANWSKVLKKGGKCFILVPAYNFLWSEHDDINYHFRRYTTKELVAKSEKAGFSIIRNGYNYMLLFIPTAIFRLLQNLLGKKEKDKQSDKGQILILPSFVHKLLAGFQKIENSLSRIVRLPFGVTAFVVATKR